MLRITFVVLALASCALAADGPCFGCIVEHDPNSPEAVRGLEVLLFAVHAKNIEVTKITRYASQIVDGEKYYFTYKLKGGKTCKGSYVSQSWVSPDPVDPENKCT